MSTKEVISKEKIKKTSPLGSFFNETKSD